MTTMSAACMPPRQPPVSERDRKHPRFTEYLNYRGAMSAQLVGADSFESWLRQIEDNECSKEIVFETQIGATLPRGFYKHRFAPGHELVARLGPFTTRAEAESA